MRPLHRAVPTVLAALALAASGATGQEQIAVDRNVVAALDVKLEAFAGTLAPGEQTAWSDLLARAASAPADAGSRVALRGTLYRRHAPPAQGIVVQGGRTNAQGIVVQGGRTSTQGIVVQGGRTTNEGIVVQGGRTANQGIVVQGGRTSAQAIVVQGGRTATEEDVRAVGEKLAALAAALEPAERAVLDWLTERAERGAGAPRPAMQGQVRLAQALAVQDDVRPGWVLVLEN